jgi:hypothetical protein
MEHISDQRLLDLASVEGESSIEEDAHLETRSQCLTRLVELTHKLTQN